MATIPVAVHSMFDESVTVGSAVLNNEMDRFLGVNRLVVTTFRNYERCVVEPTRPLIVLYGENGAGKTNLLEAVSLLVPGRGMRGVPFVELANASVDQDGWAVAARLDGPMGVTDIGTGLSGGAAGDGRANRLVRIDSDDVRSAARLGDYVRMLWITPSMDRLFAGPPGDRRRFLDRLVGAFDSAHGTRVNAFEKAMRERNRLLENGSRHAAWIDGIEIQMAELGVAIAAARLEAVGSLVSLLDQRRICRPESPFPWVRLSLDGEIEQLLEADAAVEVEDKYRTILGDSRSRDAAAGRTLSGPHRTDMMVVHGPKNVEAQLCSTGEQKALLIAMVLAHARVIQGTFDGYPPILLLDEIAAHLDRGRCQALFDELAELGAQVWMTGTDKALFSGLSSTACFFAVSDGTVKPVPSGQDL